MKDRLKELLNECRGIEGIGTDLIEKQADHLLANGVIVPPCKVGDMVYMPWQYNEVQSIACLKVTIISNILGFGWSVGTDFDTDDEGYAEKYKCGRFEFADFGKTVFLTREEAETALRNKEI